MHEILTKGFCTLQLMTDRIFKKFAYFPRKPFCFGNYLSFFWISEKGYEAILLHMKFCVGYFKFLHANLLSKY